MRGKKPWRLSLNHTSERGQPCLRMGLVQLADMAVRAPKHRQCTPKFSTDEVGEEIVL